MIFLDESGKRWKRIKHSTAAMTLLGTLPVLALIGGSLAYHPQWGSLPIVKQVAGVVSSNSSKSNSDSATSTTPKQASKSTTDSTSSNNQQLAFQPAGTSSNTPSSTSTPSTVTTQPATTPTQPQSTSPTGGDPAQNDYGQSHKPVK